MRLLKSRLIRWLNQSAANERLYARMWHPVVRAAAQASVTHRWSQLDREVDAAAVERYAALESVVLNGPFAGMKYPTAEAAGSMYVPKILGTYEAELHPFVESVVADPPARVIDVGSAEGYYAVGLAMRLPQADVVAYDTSPNARGLCTRLAEANGVGGRVRVESTCRPQDLLAAPPGRRLIISDCEGFEKQLFTDAVCAALAGDTVLVELHDWVDPSISKLVRDRFRATHRVTSVPTVTDFARPLVFCCPQVQSESFATRVKLMAEYRPLEMEWLVCRPKGA